MKNICFYFQIQTHQVEKYGFFEIGRIITIMMIITPKSKYAFYQNNRFCRPIKSLRHDSQFKRKVQMQFSISGVALEQFELYAPEVIDSPGVGKTGSVEFWPKPMHILCPLFTIQMNLNFKLKCMPIKSKSVWKTSDRFQKC